MDEEVVEERLIEIRERLDVIIHLLLAPIQVIEPDLRGKTQREVLKLCDLLIHETILQRNSKYHSIM